MKIKSIPGGVHGLSCTCHGLKSLSYPWPFSALFSSPPSTLYFSRNTSQFPRNLLIDTQAGPLATPTSSKTGQLQDSFLNILFKKFPSSQIFIPSMFNSKIWKYLYCIFSKFLIIKDIFTEKNYEEYITNDKMIDHQLYLR